MTSTPVSLNDESLNGSWIDINSASQIHSPIDNDSPEHMRPPYSLAESVQSLGLLSFQVERFLQEAQKSQCQGGNQEGQPQQYQNVDNISDICLSESDMSADELIGSKSLMDSLREHNNRSRRDQARRALENLNLQDHQTSSLDTHMVNQRLSISEECLADQLSDSLSLLSRASLFAEAGLKSDLGAGSNNTMDETSDFDWLWDWTAQPEYFSGREWKISPPRQEYLMKKRQLYTGNSRDERFSGEIVSLLFLTNILSIIIGAGITYSLLLRRTNV